jgi:tetratricopeptide (TPR) repeat protein
MQDQMTNLQMKQYISWILGFILIHLSHFTHSIESDPRDGLTLIREGRIEEAAQAFLEYARATGSAAHYYNAALAFSELGKSDMVARALQASIFHSPTFWDAWTNFGVFFQQSEELTLAMRCYRVAARSPDPHRRGLAHYNIGAMNLRAADIPRAHAAFLAASRADPSLAVAADGLGAVYWRRGRARTAQGMFGRALALQPDLAEAYFNLGNLERGRGNWFKAVDFLSAAAAGVARGSSNPTLFWAQVHTTASSSHFSTTRSSLRGLGRDQR